MICLFFLVTFSVGERLEYVAKFGFLNLGSMTLECRDTLIYDETDCYLFTSILTSNPGLSFIFTLNDTIDVYARRKNLLPLFYEEKIHEGKYNHQSEIHFDQENHSVVYDDSIHFELYDEARDLLSFWYYLRTIPLLEGDTIPLNIHTAKKNYKVDCFVAKKEKIKTYIGEFNTILVEPRTEEQGMFAAKGGMQIWYSDDNERYPVQIKTKLKAGIILFKLKGVKS